MNNDQYIKIIETCKTREELVRLIENTVKKKRDDLAIIADKYLQEGSLCKTNGQLPLVNHR